jgi:hypothetical protein
MTDSKGNPENGKEAEGPTAEADPEVTPAEGVKAGRVLVRRKSSDTLKLADAVLAELARRSSSKPPPPEK